MHHPSRSLASEPILGAGVSGRQARDKRLRSGHTSRAADGLVSMVHWTFIPLAMGERTVVQFWSKKPRVDRSRWPWECEMMMRMTGDFGFDKGGVITAVPDIPRASLFFVLSKTHSARLLVARRIS